jgi:hypothetical protein
MRGRRTGRRMGEQSHREEMSAAIRAQRERQKAGKPAAGNRPLLARLLARLRGK